MRFLSVADVYVMSFMPPLHRFRYGCRTRNLFREGDMEERGMLGNMEDDAANADADADANDDDDDDRNNCVCG